MRTLGLIAGMRSFALALTAVAGLGTVQAGSDFGSKPHPGAQAAADVVRDVARADAAFLAAGLLKDTSATDLATLLQYPTDEVVVVALKGSQLKQALERSVAGYPQSNSAFLQLSGMSVTFSESAAPDSRILDVQIGGGSLSPAGEYSIAMPASLARGALGYFKIWDKSQIRRVLGITVEGALKGKTGTAPSPRYIVKP